MLPESVRLWASVARDWFALFYTPLMTVQGWVLIAILADGKRTISDQRVAAIATLAYITTILVGLGGMWFQRNRLEALKFSAPGGFGGEVSTEEEK